MNNLKEYLQAAMQDNSPVYKNLVFGNTSADMDSVVGSILMSWFYGTKTGVKYTPVVYCTRHELTFRFEILGHLSTFGIDEPFLRENVIFKDDFQEREREVFAGVESVGLIDFNKLTKELSCISDKVHYIIDHHADHKKYLNTIREKKTMICGSATTLIVQKMLQESDLFATANNIKEIQDLALFACAPLSLDSISFQMDFKDHKWIDLDEQMFEQLCFYYNSNPVEYLECCKINKYDIKQNVELGCYNNLIKNYKTFDYIKQADKTFKGIGIASIYIPINEFIQNFGLKDVVKELQSQMKKNNLGIFMIITKEFRKINHKKHLLKEIMVFADQVILEDDQTQLKTLLAALESDKDLNLYDKVDYIGDDRDLRLVNYKQGNIVKDRKTLDKFLKGFYNL